MKIGILTYHWVANYGANLQALSTYSYLQNKGLNPIIINWVPEDAFSNYIKDSSETQIRTHNRFIEEHCRLTRRFSAQNEIRDIIQEEGITHIVIGSDALFNIIRPHFHFSNLKFSHPSSDHIYPNLYWGEYLSQIPHVGLSISSQNARYFEFFHKKKQIGNSLLGFREITVRDTWTRKMVSYFTKGKIVPTITPDPVFSFNNNFTSQPTREVILQRYNLKEKYVIVSFDLYGPSCSPDGWVEELKSFFSNKDVEIVNMPRPVGGQSFSGIKTINMPVDPMDWYCLIKYSYAYVGVLMHPIVICLHNNVRFYSFDQYGVKLGLYKNEKSSKTYHILNEADLLDYHWSVIKHKEYPKAITVAEKIMDFPMEKIRSFSAKMIDMSLNCYEGLIESLKK